MEGERVGGEIEFVRDSERQEPWLLIKSDDEYARKKSAPDILEERDESAATGRSMEEIAGAKKGKVWHSKPKDTTSKFDKVAARLGIKRKASNTSRTKTWKPRTTAFRAKGASRKGNARIPNFVEPCLATLSSAPPSNGDWVHEIKFDGYRMQARLDGGRITLGVSEALRAGAPVVALTSLWTRWGWS